MPVFLRRSILALASACALIAGLTISPSNAVQFSRQATVTRVLAQIPVKGRAPKTGYSRAQFGQAWADTNHNGCDTRNDILKRDLSKVVFRAGTHNCVVLSGVLHDPYSGTNISFVRGVGTSYLVQIDHIVSLSNAWQTGAFKLSLAARTLMANDPLELLAVKGSLNSQKSDGDAATWLPPLKRYRCAFVARQVAVKAKYGLWVTKPEKEVIARILTGCPKEVVPIR
jgi:hypothetical protein